MELSELTAYASEKYQIREEHKWADFPGFSVLCHPQTGKWIALLMRQWDTESGTEIERCDLKCGSNALVQYTKSYLAPPIRMHGSKWISVAFDSRTERETVCALFDSAIRLNAPQGYTIVLASQLPSGEGSYQDTALPFAGSSYQPHRENMPERLREMRRLFEYGRESEESRARNFYRQAVFMQDYEDDVPWSGEFVRYFPTYRDLTTRQLRGYFTWRSGVRKGQFQPIAASAAYIYIYELLNGVGALSPEDALQKLRAFERGFLDSGIGDRRMRVNLRRWMLEYAVVNNLPPEIARAYIDLELTARDEAIAVLRKPDVCSDDAVFSALCVFGGKKLAQSPVIALDPLRGKHLFAESWRAASAYRWEEKKLFSLCFGEKKTRRWYPLSNAVYYEQRRSANRDYVLNECRSYRCRAGLWTVRAFDALSFDKARFQGFLHETDARLRRYLKTGRYLRENPADEWADIYIDAVIEADRKAQAEASRPKIEIDLSGLERIRRDAAGTRDSLLTEDETEDQEEAAVPDETKAPSDLPLDDVQIRILRSLLRGEDAAAIMAANRMMPSIAADFLNEALYDEIGDTVVVCEDDRLMLVEDYREDLTVLLGGSEHGGA